MAYVPYEGGELPNIVNVTKRMDPNGSIAKIAELLDQYNPILSDIPLIEGNLPTGHRTTVRSDTPTPTWRKLNYGVRPTKSNTTQVDDTVGMCEDFAEIDKDLADLNGNTAEFRMSEDRPHIEGISNDMASTLFYGDTSTDPEKFLGFSPRYDVVDVASTKHNAQVNSSHLNHVIDNGGTGANLTSLWYIVWGEDTVHGIFPKGSKAGLITEDLGKSVLYDNDGGRYIGYRSHYQWKMGLCVRDWRFVGRLANIDLTDLDDPAAQATLYKNMIKLMHAIPASGRNRGIFYCGQAIAAMLDLAAVDKSNAFLGLKEVFGEEMTAFRNRPMRETHAILENEAQIT